ncbi:MAG: AMP-binding protein [Acidimicrobiia bacterium]|nr:AMP-binding protein [Acidimicrobiia bacterium]
MRVMDATAEQIIQYQMNGQDIPTLLGHWADRRPDHPALVWDPFEGEGRTWTYAQLREDVHRLAAGLVGRGIVRGEKVLIHSENCPEMVVAFLACATVGAVAVTTNTKSVTSELEYFASKAQCVAAITQPQFAAMVGEAAPELRWLAVIGAEVVAPAIAFADLFAAGSSEWVGRTPEPMLPFGIMFTSGTTSRPKAVVHTHGNAVWASRVGPRNIDLGPDDRYLIYLPFFHVNAQSWSLFSVLGAGATAVLMPKWSTSRFWDVVTRHGITHISLMPFAIPTIMAPDRPAEHTMRIGVFGLVMPELDQMLGIEVYAAFGMTETVTHSVTGKPKEQLPTRSMGHVAPGYEVLVMNQDTGQICDVDEPGELWLRGTRGIQLFLEYFDNPEANEKAFEAGWFKTGDIVKLGEAGNVFYMERDKDLLKVGGENVSAREVEELVGTVAGVGQVAVVGKHHEFLDQVVVAFVITTPDAPEHAELEANVIAACRQSLADFKVPRAVYVVTEFPTGTLDKLLKNKLREMADAEPPV